MKKWIKTLLPLLPIKDVLDLMFEWLDEQAKKTDNQLDDNAVRIMRTMTDTAFGSRP